MLLYIIRCNLLDADELVARVNLCYAVVECQGSQNHYLLAYGESTLGFFGPLLTTDIVATEYLQCLAFCYLAIHRDGVGGVAVGASVDVVYLADDTSGINFICCKGTGIDDFKSLGYRIRIFQRSALVEYNRGKIICVADDDLPYIIISGEDTGDVESTIRQDGIGESGITGCSYYYCV